MTKEQHKQLEADLWSAADNLRANSDLTSNEYSVPILGLIFLKFADNNYSRYEKDILAEYQKRKGTRLEKEIYEIAIAKCRFYLPESAKYDHLLKLKEEENIAKAVRKAMVDIETYNSDLADTLPKDEYHRFADSERTQTILKDLLKNFANIPMDAQGDLFGRIYEYFLSAFARTEGQKGGEFFTPRSVVQLMVSIIEPHGGEVFDPACGSGGMFVQSDHFIKMHRNELTGSERGVFFQRAGKEVRNSENWRK